MHNYPLPQAKGRALRYENPVLAEMKGQTALLEKICRMLAAEKKSPTYGNDYITTKEAAAALKCSAHTIRRWLKDGVLPGIKLNKGSQSQHYLIPREAVEDLIKDSSLKQ